MKSPLKDKPLRNPGQSLDNELRDLVFDKVLFYFTAAVIFVLLAVVEWWRYYAAASPSPRTYTVIALVVCLLAGWKIWRYVPYARNLKQGREGEKAVGQYLESVRESGAKVFHDVVGDGFNLDHVVIGSHGIYVVETKTWSKPDRGEARLVFDGDAISGKGRSADRAPVIQAKAASQWLRELLRSSTGRDFPVRGVVVFPGWYVERTSSARASDIWVLNPKALPAFIRNSRRRVSDEDVHLCSYHLCRYIRTKDD